jgi:hypothetical protein
VQILEMRWPIGRKDFQSPFSKTSGESQSFSLKRVRTCKLSVIFKGGNFINKKDSD